MHTIHYAPGTIALATLIALEEAGVDYTARKVSFADGEQKSAAYLAINPKGRVPALVRGEFILTETPALLTYVAQIGGDSVISMPQEPDAAAQIHSFNSYLASTVHVAHAHRMRGSRWADDEAAHESMRRKVPQSVTESMLLIENDYLSGPWVMGEEHTLCDPYLFTIARWLEGDGADIARLPKITAHRERMAQRDAVKRAMQVEER